MLEVKDLLYYNGFGGFSKDGKEYIIKTGEKYTPLPWTHMFANEKFGSLVTSTGGGYTWSKNSRDNKITTWSNDPIEDKASELIFLKSKDGKLIHLLPCGSLDRFEVHYGFGYAAFFYEDGDISSKLIEYVPGNESKKVFFAIIENKSKDEEDAAYDLSFKANVVLGVSKEYTKKHLVIKELTRKSLDDSNMNNCCGAQVRNFYREFYKEEIVNIMSSEACMVYVDEEKNITLTSKISVSKDERKVIKFEIEIVNCDDENEINLTQGMGLQDNENLMKELICGVEKIKSYWDNKLSMVKVRTPIESMNILMNGWLAYQTIVSRLWGRTAFYQAGGAFGFRDQLQDSLLMLYVDPEYTRNQILYHAKHQFKEGDVLHWWHVEKDNGIRTRYTDDLLWLPYLICEYVEKEGDYSILDVEIPYVETELLKDEEGERYGEVKISEDAESLYVHATRAIDKSLNFGSHGLPKMGTGDWNDGMNRIKGESVWLGFFMYDVIRKFCRICEYRMDTERVGRYKETIERLKENLNNNAWDGNWFKRAFFEDGTPLGSSDNDECKIDGISQSWAVISEAAEKDKCIQAMNSLENYLVDKENMIIKLLTPPFSKTTLDPGYIKSYIPGVRENGGQYTHGAVWSVIANAKLGDTERAGEYFRLLNPIEHARTKESALKYKVEPYVVSADIYSSSNMLGRGGWTWYTGSSSWLYIAGLEYVLGLRKLGKKLVIYPCIPNEWESYSIEYKYKEAMYKINVYNPEKKGKGIKTIYFNNDLQESNEVELKETGENTIDVILG